MCCCCCFVFSLPAIFFNIYALEQGLNSTKDIDALVGQISYRAADLAYLLDLEQKELSDYSELLRD